MSQKTKVVAQKTLFDGQFIKLTEKTLDVSGATHTHYNVWRVPTVTVFPITPEKEIYLIREYRYLYGKVLLEAVAGTVEKDESLLAAAKRELLEEAGIGARQWQELTEMILAGSYIDARVGLFVAQDLRIGAQTLEDDEEIEVVKMPIEQAVEKIKSREIITASTITGILMVDRMIKEGNL